MAIINSPLVFIDLQAGYYEVLSVWLHAISDTDGLNSLCCCCIVKDVWRTRSSEEARTSTLLRWSSFHTHIPQNRRCRWDWNLWRAAGNRNTSPHSRQEVWNKLCVMRTVLFLCSSPSWSDWQMRGWRRARPPVRGDKSILHRAGERRCEIRFPKTKNWSVCGTGTHRFLSSRSHTACCL